MLVATLGSKHRFLDKQNSRLTVKSRCVTIKAFASSTICSNLRFRLALDGP